MTDTPIENSPETPAEDTPTLTFESLGLGPNVLKSVAEAGYEIPTPIQAEAIPHVILGGDVTGIAQTGTGKTAAFVLPMIHRLARGRARARMPRCLILAPTRELAAQVSENFDKYGKYNKLTMALLIGGVSFGEQEKLLMRGVDVLIATPGRLMDQFERGKILLTGVETLIIDEADRMLDMGFIPDIEKICSLLPKKRQTLLFSATMPKEIARLAETFQNLPKRVEVSRPTQTAETITQHVVKLAMNDAKAKRTALRRVIETCDINNGIVFCNRKREVDVVAASLIKHGFDAAAIHGDLPQAYRTQTLERFRDGDLKLLVASDVAARGLDIPDVSHVFNYAPPPKDEDYIHRIGRTGRAGRTGESYTIVAPEDGKAWDGVLRMIKKDVAEFMPEGLEDELKDLPPDQSRSRGRGRGGRGRDRDRDRGGRSRSRDEAPQSTEDSGRSSARSRDERSSDERPDGPRRERSRSRDYKRKDDDPILEPAKDGGVGFGDHVPDFLKR
ncbi:MAG: DEAD/DEAH box helicase [Pseudomonadota bacterium]